LIDSITDSSANTFLGCPGQYFYEYTRRLDPKKLREYFIWGTLVHIWARLRVKELEPQALMTEMQRDIAKLERPLAEQECMYDMLGGIPPTADGHLLRWGRDDLAYESMMTETEFKYQIGDFTFRGKIDGVLRNLDTGELLLYELKTSSMTGPSLYRTLPLDSQLRGYLFAVQRCFGMDVRRVIYDVIKTPQIKRGPVENRADYYRRMGLLRLTERAKYYERTPVTFTQDAIDSHEFWLASIIANMRRAEASGYWLRWHPVNHWPCPFEEICMHGGDDIEWAMNEFIVRPENALHPELS